MAPLARSPRKASLLRYFCQRVPRLGWVANQAPRFSSERTPPGASPAGARPAARSKSDRSGGSRPGHRLKRAEEPGGKGEIRLSSIHRFKGLESPVVVVAEVDESAATNEALLYVAFSRARSHLVLIAHEKVIELFKKER